MELTVYPGKIRGRITPPPSKSQSHRLIIAAALADGRSVIRGAARSQDIDATLSCMAALGAQYEWRGDELAVRGIGAKRRSGELPELDCGESGSTLRFLIPVALAVAGGGVFRGRGRLMQRPQEPYFRIFDEKGIAYETGENSLTVRGTLAPGEYALRGDVSSQFVTGLLYALPLIGGESEIRLTTPLESKSYVDMTLDALALFGVSAEERNGNYRIGGGAYSAADARVEPDWSQAAFFYAARGIGNELEINGMNDESKQGDRVIAELCERLGRTGEVSLDVSDCPDLVPALALRAALRDGETTHIVNAARLRLKESDRLSSVTDVLDRLGARIREKPDGLDITGVAGFAGGVRVSAHSDHRIAMTLAVAATRCERAITIEGAECVAKSYPDFWKDMEKLGLAFGERRETEK